MRLQVGSRIFGNWVINGIIGKGSYGTVYEIEKNEYGLVSHAAVKVICVEKPDKDNSDFMMDGLDSDNITDYYQEIIDNMIDECALMEQMKGDSHIVSYEDHQIEQDENGNWIIYIRMELLTPLPIYLKNRVLSQQDVVQMGIDLCEGLETCHRNNVIHRDIKPDNIYVTDIGTYKLGDFGISKALVDTEFAMSQKGTRSYMAPEVYRGEPYDKTTDLYCLGLVLYRYMNENRLPFLPLTGGIRTSERDKAINRRMSGESIPAPVHALEGFSQVICKACSFHPADRYASAGEMRIALENVLEETAVTIPEEKQPIHENKLNPLAWDGQEDGTVNLLDKGKQNSPKNNNDKFDVNQNVNANSSYVQEKNIIESDIKSAIVDREISERRERQKNAQEDKEKMLREKQEDALDKEKEMERIREAVKAKKDPFAPIREEEEYDVNGNVIISGEKKWNKKSNVVKIKLGLAALAVVFVIALVQIVRHQQMSAYNKERDAQYTQYLEASKSALEEEDFDKAVAESQKAIAVNNNDEVAPYDILVKSYIGQGKFEQAAETIRDAKKNPEEQETLVDFSEQEQLITEQAWNVALQCVQNSDTETGYTMFNMLSEYLPDNNDINEKKQVMENANSIKELLSSGEYEIAQEKLNEIIGLGYDDVATCFNYVNYASFAPVVGDICAFIDSGDYDSAYSQIIALWSSCQAPFYYQDGMVVPGVVEGRAFYTDGQSYVYYGEMIQSIANGNGYELGTYGEGYYRIAGNFAEGYANGDCEVYYSNYLESDGKTYQKTIAGNYSGGYEDGEMSVVLKGKKKTYKFSYTASNGSYMVIAEEDGKYIYADGKKVDLYKTLPEELESNGVPRRAPRQ